MACDPSGKRVIIGSRKENGDDGEARIYDYNMSTNMFQQFGNTFVGQVDSRCGQDVALSPDGLVFGVGSWRYSPNGVAAETQLGS